VLVGGALLHELHLRRECGREGEREGGREGGRERGREVTFGGRKAVADT